MKDKLKISLICALAALIAGPLLFLILAGSGIMKTVIACIITAAVIAAVMFFLTYKLDGKSLRFTVPVYILAGFVSLITAFSVIIINIAPTFLFHPHFDEDAYEELLELDGKAGRPAPEYLESSSGTITGWRLPAKDVPEDRSRPAVLVLMGNGQEASSYAMYIIEHDDIYGGITSSCDMFMFDYPQYGQSTGHLTASGLREMSLEAYETVDGISVIDDIYVMGYSIGTGVACYLASEADVDGLILMAPYRDSYDIYNNVLDLFHGPTKLLVTYRMNSYKYAKKVSCPVIIFASDADEVIPYRSSQALFTCFSNTSVDFVTVTGAAHNDFLSDQDVLSRTAEFITGG